MVPGGSSGGSAAAVAARLAPAATATDTGGSIRQPAALVRRHRLQAHLRPRVALRDDRVCLEPRSGRRDRGERRGCGADAGRDGGLRSARIPPASIVPCRTTSAALNQPLKGLRIGLLKEFFEKGLDAENERCIRDALAVYEKLGAALREVSLPNLPHVRARVLRASRRRSAPRISRASTACAYGYRCKEPRDLMDLYKRSRGEGFGAEVKRRIMTGTYVLSAGYYDAYYLQAQKVRQLISRGFRARVRAGGRADGADHADAAFELGAKTSDPVTMYLNDIYTIGANLAGLPAMSIPCGFAQQLPVGLQIIGPHFAEEKLLERGAPSTSRRRTGIARVPEALRMTRAGKPSSASRSTRSSRRARRSSPAPRRPTARARTRRRTSSTSAIRACCRC